MKLRYEFEEPDDRGRRRVRAYDGDECAMSGILDPQIVNVTPPVVHSWCPMHEDREAELDGLWPVGTPVTSIRMVDERAHDAIAQLIAVVRQSYVFIFLDFDPWRIDDVASFDTRAEADAYELGFDRHADEDTFCLVWPFTEAGLMSTKCYSRDLAVDVRARVKAMGLIPAEVTT